MQKKGARHLLPLSPSPPLPFPFTSYEIGRLIRVHTSLTMLFDTLDNDHMRVRLPFRKAFRFK